MSALDDMRNEYEKRLAALKQTALAAVGHVGFANYEHRERAASQPDWDARHKERELERARVLREQAAEIERKANGE